MPRGRGSCSRPRRSPPSTARSTLARAGVETGGAGHNRRFTAPALTVADGVAPELVALAHDPQTSGGLLAAVDPDAVAAVEADLAAAGVNSWRVGRVEPGEPGVALA